MSKQHGPTWTPSPLDYDRVLYEQSPWQFDGQVPQALAPEVERPLAQSLWARLDKDEPRRFQLILGPRRVGKTTCLYQTVRRLLAENVPAQRLWWLRLDHPLLMTVPLDDLLRKVIKYSKATPAEPAFVFLDELTYARDWELWLKTFYDEHWPIHLAGSSSSTAAISKSKRESGVGRWEEQYLAPYLLTEFMHLAGHPMDIPVGATLADTLDASIDQRLNTAHVEPLRDAYMLIGGFPELLVTLVKDLAGEQPDLHTTFLQSQRTLRTDAVERAIYKDIPQVYGVSNPMLLERMLYTLAAQATGVLSPKSICQSLDGLSQPTFDNYLNYLCQSFLVFVLPNYAGSEETIQRRGRKLYFVDGAVRNAALQRGVAPLNDPGEKGLLFENLVAGHLHALSQQSQVRLYHWREGKFEVDLVYDHPTAPIAFEIASSPGHTRAGLKRFVEKFPRYEGNCYMVSPSAVATHPHDSPDMIGTLPLDLLLVAAGAQAEAFQVARLAP